MTSHEQTMHNQAVLDHVNPGDMLEFVGTLYNHWAVYVGDEEVVHLSGVDGAGGTDLKHPGTICGAESNNGIIRKDGFWEVANNRKVSINNSKDKSLKLFERNEIVKRATSEVGNRGYNALFKNCEHFASWCRYGKVESDQASGLLAVLAVGAVAAVGGLVAFVLSGAKQWKEKMSKN